MKRIKAQVSSDKYAERDRPLNQGASKAFYRQMCEMKAEPESGGHLYGTPGGFGHIDRARTISVRSITTAGKIHRKTFIAYDDIVYEFIEAMLFTSK